MRRSTPEVSTRPRPEAPRQADELRLVDGPISEELARVHAHIATRIYPDVRFGEDPDITNYYESGEF